MGFTDFAAGIDPLPGFANTIPNEEHEYRPTNQDQINLNHGPVEFRRSEVETCSLVFLEESEFMRGDDIIH